MEKQGNLFCRAIGHGPWPCAVTISNASSWKCLACVVFLSFRKRCPWCWQSRRWRCNGRLFSGKSLAPSSMLASKWKPEWKGGAKFWNKPAEYPQQPETKTVAKHAMSEVCLLPRPSYSRGRACKAQSQHKHFMKKRFSKSVCNTVANIPKARAKGFFPQRAAVRLTLHFIYLTCIIHISYVLYITYIFYTIFYAIFSRSTSTSTP